MSQHLPTSCCMGYMMTHCHHARAVLRDALNYGKGISSVDRPDERVLANHLHNIANWLNTQFRCSSGQYVLTYQGKACRERSIPCHFVKAIRSIPICSHRKRSLEQGYVRMRSVPAWQSREAPWAPLAGAQAMDDGPQAPAGRGL